MEILKQILDNQTLIFKYAQKHGLNQRKFYPSVFTPEKILSLNNVQIIAVSDEVNLIDVLGNVHKHKNVTVNEIEKKLLNYPQFIKTHEKFIVNLNHLDYLSPDKESNNIFLGFKNTSTKAILSPPNFDKIKKYFGIKSLVHVEPWSEEYQAILDENLRTFDKEIRFMNPEELKNNFKYLSTGEFNIREFMANMIWEYYNLLQIGKRDPIEGNIRTFWYYLKPTLSKVVNINSMSHYGIMIDTFKNLIVNHKLFKYKDFGFISDSEGNYIIGNRNPNIILVGEKAGHLKKLKRIQDEYGVTIAVLGGMPSILSTEYLVDELEKVFDIRNTPVHLITLVDYNPSSAIIALTFHNQLKHENIQNILSISHLLTPNSFSKEELPHVTDQIPTTSPADKTKLRKWLNAGGGVDFGDGIKQPLGIETEALILDFERLKNIFKSKFDSIINTSIVDKSVNNYDILNIDVDINFLTLGSTVKRE